MEKSLPTAILGRTGIRVARLGYGAGHRKPQDSANAKVVHEGVLNAGVTLIDTADCYGNSEELIGKFLAGRSSEYYVATKCGGSSSGHEWTRKNCMRTLEESLLRLKTSTIDIMQLHNPTVTEAEEGDLVEALIDMKKSGKVRWIGASTTMPHLATYLDWGVFDIFQLPYSALERDHEEWITKAAEAGAGILIRGGVALGEPGIGKGSSERWDKFMEADLDELRDPDEDRTSFILRFTLSHPHTHSIIVGTTSLEHLQQNVAAILKGPLLPETYGEAKKRLDAVGVSPLSSPSD
mgnify:CR=1 FL=1